MNIDDLIKEYNVIKENEKVIAKRKKEVAEEIKKYAEENGVKDSSGSYYKEQGSFMIGKQARKTVKLNEEKAKELLVSMKLYEKVKVITEKVDEEKLSNLVETGELTIDDLESISDIKVTYAIDVREVVEEEEENAEGDMPEVEVIEKSKKKSIFKRVNK